MSRCILLLVVGLFPLPVLAQGRTPASSPCWRFAFGDWSPPLDWAKAGHPGDAGATASAIRKIRDSVFARDTVAGSSNAMFWEKTSRGTAVVLYPPWWPAGVLVSFDSTLADGKEMFGTATALVADAGQVPSKARARAWQSCAGR